MRRFHALRSVALVILAFGLAAQSLLGVLGEMHEIAAHAEVAQAHEGHVGTPAHHHADGDETTESKPLHVLLHHTHCCSHCAWMSGGESPVTIAAIASADLPMDTAGYLPASGITTPFRPPIRA